MKTLKLIFIWLWSFIYHETLQHIVEEKIYTDLNYKKYYLYRIDYFLYLIPVYVFIDETDNLICNTKNYQSWGFKYNIIRIKTTIQ